jgi:hypothetical protein
VKYKLLYSIVICFVVLAVTIVPVGADAVPFGSTNIGYGNTITEIGPSGNVHIWSAQYYDYSTFPSQTMPQLGATVFTTYAKCGNNLFNYQRLESNNISWMIQTNVKSYHGAPYYKYDVVCPDGSLSLRGNDVVHYWQKSGGATGGAIQPLLLSYNNPTFLDVSTEHWAYKYIESASQLGIMDPAAIYHKCSLYSFCPLNKVERSEMAYFLERGIRGSDESLPQGSGVVFSDVPQSYELYWLNLGYPLTNVVGFIEKLKADAITGGCATNPLRYCPEGTVTRAQMAIFLLRAEHGNTYQPPAVGGSTVFADVPGNYWAAAWVQQFYNEGITSGCSVDPLMYCPEQEITRAEMAVFLMRTFAP